MEYKEFEKLITGYKSWNKRIDEVGDILGCDNMYELDWIEYTCIQFQHIIEYLFNEEGIDWINWWLFEREDHSDDAVTDADGNVIPSKTVEDLWNLVKICLK
jgi:hypothetical protein